ncbi:hypothetical protein Areg01_74890 [Actinoplanes regularis]|nr:hypothetical protein Areg01_74890 [Actinoplanes regularis]
MIDVATVDGWILEGNVVRFLTHLSRRTGYEYAAADEDALVGALDKTDDESGTAWFRYPLQGTPPVVVALAQAVGGGVVSVGIDGDIDAVLEARIDTMLSASELLRFVESGYWPACGCHGCGGHMLVESSTCWPPGWAWWCGFRGRHLARGVGTGLGCPPRRTLASHRGGWGGDLTSRGRQAGSLRARPP